MFSWLPADRSLTDVSPIRTLALCAGCSTAIFWRANEWKQADNKGWAEGGMWKWMSLPCCPTVLPAWVLSPPLRPALHVLLAGWHFSSVAAWAPWVLLRFLCSTLRPWKDPFFILQAVWWAFGGRLIVCQSILEAHWSACWRTGIVLRSGLSSTSPYIWARILQWRLWRG